MKSLTMPALSRATLLWLAVALGSALLWFLTLRGIPPFLTGFTPFFAFGLAVALGFGLPLSLLVPLIASPLPAASCRYDLQRVALFFVGGILAVLSIFFFFAIMTTPQEAPVLAPAPMLNVELLCVPLLLFLLGGVAAFAWAGSFD